MSYFIPSVNIKSNPQESLEYAIYMIFSSYFKRTTCKSPVYESKLRFNYRETELKTQYKLEEFCEKKAKQIFRCLPAKVADSEVEVFFILREGYYPEIRFVGNDFILRVSGSYHRRDVYDLRAQILSK